jgi:hypothetical protein
VFAGSGGVICALKSVLSWMLPILVYVLAFRYGVSGRVGVGSRWDCLILFKKRVC